MIIFCETKKGCDQLTRSLRGQSYPARCIHGDKDQRERDEALADFRSGVTPILIATDVAARGLDVKDVRIVVNFDMYVPVNLFSSTGRYYNYSHRIHACMHT